MRHNPSMRRVLVFILLILMPLQFSFAAAAVYCETETQMAAEHFGHHDHEGPAAPLANGDEPAPGAESDCDVCHLACAKFKSEALTVLVFDLGTPPATRILLPSPQNAPEPCDRPPIVSAA
jgi:hypothetical protein